MAKVKAKAKRSRSAGPDMDLYGDDSDEKLSKKSVAELSAAAGDDYDVDDDKTPPKPAKKAKSAKVDDDPRESVSLSDNRKLTKKDKQNLSGWKGKNRTKMLDVFLRRQRDDARKKFGHNSVYIGSESESLVIGIPCPALAFEYVIGQDCFPLGLVMQIVAKHGVGKCLGHGTPVVLADGRIVPVEQVIVGDRLAGADGTARTVLAITQGRSPLYQVTPTRGEPWVCNDAHILTVVNCDSGAVRDIAVAEWLAETPTFRRRHMQFSVGVAEFEGGDPFLPVDPYFLGAWFGDGTKKLRTDGDSPGLRVVKLTNVDKEVIAACAEIAERWGLRLHQYEDDYSISSDTKGGFQEGQVNKLLRTMRDLVGPDVEVPEEYLCASRNDRLQFLAGYIDTDGTLSNTNCFVVSQKREDWARAIWRVARSLGFCATISEVQKSCSTRYGRHRGTYHSVTISGDVDLIPTRIPRKRAAPRRQEKTATRTGFSVTPLGEGAYYGFMLDGDGRFLLGDFTVTHNSGLLAEFGRWFDLAGGGMVLCENETKFNPYWYASIMGPDVYERMQLHRCTSVENWQEHLTWSIKAMQNDMMGNKEKPGPGKTFPVLYGVDSIMGKMSRENQEKILGTVGKKGKLGTTGEGFAQARSFPIEAGSITKYMRTVPQLLDEWPYALVLINHLRVKQDDQGNPERNKTGGEQVNFQESFELELKKVGGHAKKIACAEYEGLPLMLSCEKNSFGPTGRKAQTRVLWWHEQDDNTGHQVQKSVWDWDWATVKLLNDLTHGDNASTYIKAKLTEMDFHIECPTSGDAENSAWSKSLGMTKGDALPWNEVGALFREDKKLLRQLRDALGIVRRPLLKGDYIAQLEALAEEMP